MTFVGNLFHCSVVVTQGLLINIYLFIFPELYNYSGFKCLCFAFYVSLHYYTSAETHIMCYVNLSYNSLWYKGIKTMQFSQVWLLSKGLCFTEHGYLE